MIVLYVNWLPLCVTNNTTLSHNYWRQGESEAHIGYFIRKVGWIWPCFGRRLNWTQYIERMEYYFLANGITSADKQRAVVISTMGAKAYKTLRNLITPHNASDKSFKQLIEVMMKHFCPPPSEIAQRFKFNTRARKLGEPVANYIVELWAPSHYCNFGDSIELMLRDRIVCGINDTQTQNRPLAEKNLTYAKV